MRMRFGVEDEQAYVARREELCTLFAQWAEGQRRDADAGDVELLLDWKWGYGDGRLDRWDAADVEEFLLGWCPRKVAAPPELTASIPGSIGAYVDFLAHEDMLAPGCSPAAVRRACADLGPRFDREMADSANFGTAMSQFGGFDTADPNALLEQLARLAGTSTDEVLEFLDDPGPVVVGPVRAPTDDEVAAAVAASRVLTQIRGLAARCGAPGLTLTAKGNLRRADARALVVELATDDETDSPGRALGSATELPYLTWLVATAIAAGAVRRLRGRLVAVARFTDRTPRDAYGRSVRAALEVGLGSPMSWAWGTAAEGGGDGAVVLLAELLDAGDAGASVAELAERVGPVFAGPPLLAGLLGGSEVDHQLARLADLGLVAPAADGRTTLTAAGRSVGAEIVAEAGVEVVFRADPATADAAELVASVLLLDEDEALADLAAWARAHPFGADELVAAALHPDHGAAAVLGLLELAGTVLGSGADTAAAVHREGPHGPLVTMWLVLRGAVDPASVDPELMLVGTVDVAAAMLDDAGPEGVVDFFGTDVGETTGVLKQLWRADHERTVEVLDVLGHHHPNEEIAKAARRSVMQARSRT